MKSLSLSVLHPRFKPWRAVLLSLLASVLVISLIYLQYSAQGKWVSSAKLLSWNGEALTLIKGSGYANQGKLVIDALAEQGVAIASMTTPVIKAEDYPYVNWAIDGLAPSVEIEFLWRTAENRTFARPLVLTRNGIASLKMASDENWHGQIVSFALMVKGRLDKPIVVMSVSLKPTSAWETLKWTLGEWLTPDGWKGTSINFVDGNALDQDVPLVVAVAAWIFLALALYLISAKLNLINSSVAAVWGIIFLGWFVLDARWQWNLFKQLGDTYQQYAGKTWENKHLSAEDGALFNFMLQVKTKLPSVPSRVMFFTDDAYLRGRGAYHLYPHNVWARHEILPAKYFKSGDFVILFAFEKKEVVYNPAQHTLTWDESQLLRADMLMFSAGNALFKVH